MNYFGIFRLINSIAYYNVVIKRRCLCKTESELILFLMKMKDKEPGAVCVDGKNCSETSSASSKEIVDDSCFKTPLLLPPRKGPGRRRGCAIRNGQLNNYETRRTSSSPAESPEKDKEVSSNTSRSSLLRTHSELTPCSCSSAYISAVFANAPDRIPPMKEIVIDDFALALFKDAEDLYAFQAEIDAAKAKEEAEQRRRQYEENVRLGLVKKKGRKSKAQLEKERKDERRRLKRERKEQRRKERRERREREGIIVDPKEKKLRKERRERRRREKRERREREKKERERLEGDKKDGEKKEKKPRKPRDPNAPKKPRQPRQPKAGTSTPSQVGETPTTAATPTALTSVAVPVSWMNENSHTVCASPLQAPHALKRPSENVQDPLSIVADKRLKIEAPFDEYRNGVIGIAAKTDASAIVSASPPGAPRMSVAGAVHSEATTSCANNAISWGTTPLSRTRSVSLEQRATVTTSATSVETTHPVDPGHNAPSTSVAPSVPSNGTSVAAVSSSSAAPILSSGAGSLFVNTSAGAPTLPSAPNGALSGREFVVPTASDPRAAQQTALLDPLRQAFLSNPTFAASINAAAAAAGSTGFTNPFLSTTAPNAAAAFPFLAAHILQQQQQQPMSVAQSVAPSSALIMGQSAPSTVAAAAMQFPPGAALGSQLAGAALLGRALPAAPSTSQPTLPTKAKQGRWCAMHVKIANDISLRKERRATPQPSSASAQQSATASNMRAVGAIAPPLCPPSTSNAAHLAGLTSGFANSYSTMVANALQPPYAAALQYQQISDPSKLARQSTPKPPQGRPSSTTNRSSSTAGMHVQLGAGLGVPSSLQGSVSSVVGPSLPLAPALSASGSLTNGTSDAAAQAAMFAALAQSAQSSTSLQPSAAALGANPFLLSTAQAQHPLSAVAAGTAQASQAMFPAQRLFDPSMQAILQQVQSMEAMRQSAASQLNAAAAVQQHGASASGALDLMRLQMEQQMMDRYAAAAVAQSSNNQLDLMRQQIYAAQLRQQQQQQQQAAATAVQQQPSLETLLEMQRQQQQQQQLLQASRGLPAGFTLSAAGLPSAPSLPQGLASQMFGSSPLMQMGGAAAAAAAANLQQSLYAKNPYSNTLEQLARQKRDGDMMQQGR